MSEGRSIAATVVVGLLIVAAVYVTFSQTSGEISSLSSQNVGLSRQVDSLGQNVSELNSQNSELQQQVSNLSKEVSVLSGEIENGSSNQPTIDGAVANWAGNVSSVSAVLIAVNPNDLVYVACLVKPTTSSATVSSVTVSSPTLGAFRMRAAVSEMANAGDFLYAYTFYAFTSLGQQIQNITCSATFSSGSANMDIIAWGISGANTTSPFGSSGGAPDTCYSDTLTSSLDCLRITASQPNAMVIGVYGQLGGALTTGQVTTFATPYYTIASINGGPSGIATCQDEHFIGTYTPSVTSSNSGGVYVAIGDAIV